MVRISLTDLAKSLARSRVKDFLSKPGLAEPNPRQLHRWQSVAWDHCPPEKQARLVWPLFHGSREGGSAASGPRKRTSRSLHLRLRRQHEAYGFSSKVASQSSVVKAAKRVRSICALMRCGHSCSIRRRTCCQYSAGVHRLHSFKCFCLASTLVACQAKMAMD